MNPKFTAESIKLILMGMERYRQEAEKSLVVLSVRIEEATIEIEKLVQLLEKKNEK